MLQKLVLEKSQWSLNSVFMLYMLILAPLSVPNRDGSTEAMLQGTLAAL